MDGDLDCSVSTFGIVHFKPIGIPSEILTKRGAMLLSKGGNRGYYCPPTLQSEAITIPLAIRGHANP
jgi:hypothetical protein